MRFRDIIKNQKKYLKKVGELKNCIRCRKVFNKKELNESGMCVDCRKYLDNIIDTYLNSDLTIEEVYEQTELKEAQRNNQLLFEMRICCILQGFKYFNDDMLEEILER